MKKLKNVNQELSKLRLMVLSVFPAQTRGVRLRAGRGPGEWGAGDGTGRGPSEADGTGPDEGRGCRTGVGMGMGALGRFSQKLRGLASGTGVRRERWGPRGGPRVGRPLRGACRGGESWGSVWSGSFRMPVRFAS